jgi:hypothetical protein
MFNPYALLAGLVFAIGLFGSGVSIGYKWSERSHGAALAAAQVKAINDANTAVDLAIQRTLASAKKEADARLAARSIRHKGELDAAKKSRPECSRDAESVGLLNSAIADANGETPAGTKLSDEVRPTSAPGGWLGTVREALGVRGDRDIQPVPEAARGLRGVGE